jgi:hypothetical protein
LQLCFRYCQSYTSTTGQLSFAAFAQNSTTALSYQLLNTPMRSSPTGSIVGATAGNWNFSIGGGSDMTASSISIADISSASYSVQLGCASSSVTAGQGGRIRTSTSGYGILLSAEL